MPKARTTPIPGNHKLFQLTANVDLTQIKEVEVNGRKHLSAPVIMAVEGVMNELLYPAEELSKYVQAWNGRPVTLFHPRNTEGEFVSANSPTVINEVQLGQLFNTSFEENRLKAEVWVDVDKTQATRPEVLEYLTGVKDKLEVSTGLWGDIVQVAGDWNGAPYKGIMTNIRPDHLALLPGGEGACSWNDGCGLRANQQEDKYKEKQERLESNVTDQELRRSLQKALDQMDSRTPSQTVSNYLEEIEITKKWIVYSQSTRKLDGLGNTLSYEDKLYRRSYTLENGEATLGDDTKEVRRVVTYQDVVNQNSQKGETNVTKEEKVQALIACQRCKYQEKDRDFLMTLNEEQLDLISPPDNVVVKPEDPPPAANQKEEPKPEGSEREPHGNSVEDFLANAPAEIKDVLTESIRFRTNYRAELIKKIAAHPKNKFAANRLQAMTTEDLEGFAALVEDSAPDSQTPPANFGMRIFGNEPKVDDNGPEPLTVVNLQEVFANKNKKSA